ncbi:MAG: HD domain-containing protein [Gemmatimonadaceae bacterium]|nr:HD domain-containing protein [Gemmatimonadaceae bacterium]
MPTSSRVATYVFSLLIVAVASTAYLFALANIPSAAEWSVIALFATIGFIAHLLAYDRDGRTIGSVAFLPFLAAGGLVANVGTVGAYAVVVGIGELLATRDSIKRLFNFAQQLGGFALGLICYRLAGGQSSLVSRPEFVPFIALYAVTRLSNLLAFAGVMKFAAGRHFRRELGIQFVHGLAQDAVAIPLAYLFAVAVLKVGLVWSALLIVPLLAIRQLFRQASEAIRAHEETLELMVAAIEARDPYTSGHSVRAALYAHLIASLAARPERELHVIQKAALLHDIGKIHVHFAAILGHERQLTTDEVAVMRTHTVKGAELVSRVTTFRDLVPAIRSHHERWDGTGYPDQLSGTDIPFGARVIAFADTIDAMTTDRPYRPAMPPSAVKEEIRRLAGQQFDPSLAQLVLHPLNWRVIERAIADARNGGGTSVSAAVSAEYPVVQSLA